MRIPVTQIIPGTEPGALDQAVAALARGELVAFPTDTVYGLAASAFSAPAIERLFVAKGRDSSKAIAVLLGDLEQIGQVTPELNASARRLAQRFWPGALTLIVARHPSLPENLSPLPTIGVRIPDHPLARALLRRSGPLATTSANLSGGVNPLSAQEVLTQLGGRIALIIDGGRSPGGLPSTVVDCTGESIRVLRAGPIDAVAIREAMR
ncbi:MAG: L-threonylcarbamoyladenylate synthase [Anaerolineaceae bacterium]|nr:L-threonylcarbamoyladenylate synthase [Anaerolineaceae bacterium]